MTRIVSEHGTKGGMETHADILIKNLIKNGHHISIITTKHPSGIEYSEEPGKKVYYLSTTVPGKYSGGWWKQSAKKFIELQNKEHYDLIWSQSSGAFECIKKRNNPFGVPSVLICHGTLVSELKSIIKLTSSIRSMLSLLLKRIPMFLYHYLSKDLISIHRFNLIIAVSNELRDNLRYGYFLSKNRISVIYNGIDLDLFQPSNENRSKIREKYEIQKDDKVLLVLGRIEKQKGMHLAILAMPEILQKYPNIKLLVVGTGSYLDSLKELVINMSISDLVIFCGQISHEITYLYYCASDIFINPTMCIEAFSLVTIEAMACGVPIVSTNLGAIKSIIENEKTGLLLSHTTANDIAKNVIRILSDQKLSDFISLNAQKSAKERFNEEKMAEQTIKDFQEMIRTKKGN